MDVKETKSITADKPDLKDKRVLVTGGTRGLGKAMVHRFQTSGARVATAARSSLQQNDDSVLFIQTDLATPSGVQRVVDRIDSEWGGLDILINNAGAGVAKQARFDEMSDEEWQQTLDINLLAAVRLDRAFVPGMMERGYGVVIHISSVAARRPFSNAAVAYSAAKAALTAYSKGLARAAAPRGVRVNAVTPGFFETPLPHQLILDIADRKGISEQEARQVVLDMLGGTPIGRPGQPEELAELVAFLASEKAAFASGADYVLDGGTLDTI